MPRAICPLRGPGTRVSLILWRPVSPAWLCLLFLMAYLLRGGPALSWPGRPFRGGMGKMMPIL